MPENNLICFHIEEEENRAGWWMSELEDGGKVNLSVRFSLRKLPDQTLCPVNAAAH